MALGHLLILISILRCEGNAQQISTSSVSEIAEKDPFKRLSMQLIGNLNTNLFEESSYSKSSSMDLWILPKLNFRNETKLSLITILSREISEEHKTKLSTTRLEYSMKPIEGRAIALTPAPSIVLPTDPDLYETDTLRGAVSLTANTVLKFPIKNLTVSYAPRFTKNIHEFNTNANFKTNLEYTVRHRGAVAYNLTEKIEVSFLGDFVQGWTYRGTPRQSFAGAQDIAYAFNKSLSVSIGHSNEGAAKKEGGAGSNIEAFNDRTSEVSLGLGYVF